MKISVGSVGFFEARTARCPAVNTAHSDTVNLSTGPGRYVSRMTLSGFSRDCFAWRQRTSSLIVAGGGLVERTVVGSALDVLNEVLIWETGPPPR